MEKSRLLSHSQYEEIAERLVEAGRMLGGWLKAEEKTVRGAGDVIKSREATDDETEKAAQAAKGKP